MYRPATAVAGTIRFPSSAYVSYTRCELTIDDVNCGSSEKAWHRVSWSESAAHTFGAETNHRQ